MRKIPAVLLLAVPLAAGLSACTTQTPGAAPPSRVPMTGFPLATPSVDPLPIVVPIPPTAPPTQSGTISDGVWTVGEDIPAGTYKVTLALAASDGCYWEITKTGTNGADIISNDLPTGGRPSVTLRKGQDFKSEGCGTWRKAK